MTRTPVLLLLLAATPALAEPSAADKHRYDTCLAQARSNPGVAVQTAQGWRIERGGVPARHCLGLAQLGLGDYAAAIASLEGAALESEAGGDGQSALLWAQAGNAALLAGLTDKAVTDLSTAVAEAAGPAKADPLIDRARAYVELKRLTEAAADLDRATVLAPDNRLGWLLRATLARRMGDLPKAEGAILTAAKLSADADVELEAGNIATAQGKTDLAKQAWEAAVASAPDSDAGRAAAASLAKAAPAPSSK